MSRHVDRERAQLAWKCVDEVKKNGWRQDYRSDVRGLPAMVQTSGLAQTLAFYRSKAGNDARGRYGTVAAHLCQSLASARIPATPREAQQELLKLDAARYRAATVEVMAFLQWLKRFAEAEIEDKKEERGRG